MPEAVTPSRLVLMLFFLALDELEPEDVLAQAGLPASLLDDMDTELPMEVAAHLMATTAQMLDDPAMGLHLGQEAGIEMLDIVGMMAANAPTLRQAIEQLIEFIPLVSHMTTFDLREEGERTRMIMHLPPELAALQLYYFGEFCATFLLCQARHLLDGPFRIRRLRSRLQAPPWRAEYTEAFGDDMEVLFDQEEDSAEFDSYLLDLPLKRHSPGLYKQLRVQAARRLASRPQPESTSASVQRLINEYLGERLLDLSTIAERMGLTPRTLQRRLKEEGSTFQAVYDEIRRQRARDYLRDALEGDIDTLAAILGYSEPANFYRAFKNWFGMSPGEFRRRQRPS